MKKGPPRTEAALNALRGNPGRRPGNPDEPKPAAARSLAAPRWLKADARAIWDELAPELHRLGLLTQIDVAVLAAACRWWAIYRRADRALNGPLLAETKANGRHARPEYGIAQRAFHEAMRVFSRFGVTPSDRLHLRAPAAKPAGDDAAAPRSTDPLDQLAERRAARVRQMIHKEPAP
jgi:P27 family predicted phage terminase small subunit